MTTSASVPADFDPETYLRLNPDVAAAKDDPVTHYVTHGFREGRKYTDNSSVPADFDPETYLRLNPDVAAAKVDPVSHYRVHGFREGRIYKDASMSEPRPNTANLMKAAAAWDVSGETEEHVSQRIHDGVSLSQLSSRADSYVSQVLNLAGCSPARVLEIGPGMGYILQGMSKRLPASSLSGLDISQSMIEKASARLNRVGITASLYPYDGVNTPFPGGAFDLIYSVATLQHIPKPYVYNLFFEINRLLSHDGCAVLHFLHVSMLREQEGFMPWMEEIAQQVGKPHISERNSHGHWHHFYCAEELDWILKMTGFSDVRISIREGSVWVRVSR